MRRWYGGVAPGLVLRVLGKVYERLLLRRRAREIPPMPLPVPVVVIGNFTAGGTGKTPLCIALAEHLRDQGWRPGIASRGYGRRGRGQVRVEASTPVDISGDEPRLMFERTGLPVRVDADRVAAAQALIADGCDVVLADDGLQHRALARDIEIEVVDGVRRYGNGRLIPAGPLRERPRVTSLRVVNGIASQGGEWPMALRLGDARALGDATVRPLARFAGTRVAAVAGIGNPQRFFTALAAAGLEVDGHAFADHHDFTAADFAALPRPLLMTEKDAVKCRDLGLDDAWAVPVNAQLPAGFFLAFDSQLELLGHGRP